VGGLENDQIKATTRLGAVLRDRHYNNLQLNLEIVAGETHLSIGGAALWRGLRDLYMGQELKASVEHRGHSS
jgi:hypothetical protein